MELLVVLAIIATLMSLVAPRYTGSVDRAKEQTLRANLENLRQAIDHFYGDTGKYPAKLDDLVTNRYLRRVPIDPLTESATSWVLIPPDDPQKGAVFDIKSAAPGNGRDGTAYRDW